MNPKPTPNRQLYIQALRRMTPEQRLNKAMELTELGRELFRQGLRRRFPNADDAAIHAMYLRRLALCHNRHY